MAIQKTELIWFNGKLIEWEKATVHVLTHALHYGSSVFEGLRCYANPKGTAIFRLPPHVKRLCDSAKIYRMELPYTPEELSKAIKETVRVNHLSSGYIRPLVFLGYGGIGLNPKECPVEVIIAAIPWGKYLGEEAMEQGVDVCVSTWRRYAPDTMPALAKAGGNYLNSQLVKVEALRNGYAEGIALDYAGFVSEGSGENIFLIRNGVAYTPPLSSSVLEGITRESVITLFGEEGIEVREQVLPREMLYLADEIFFTGTAAEITPVRSVDGIQVGIGRRGPISTKIQTAFFEIVQGEREDKYGWLDFV